MNFAFIWVCKRPWFSRLFPVSFREWIRWLRRKNATTLTRHPPRSNFQTSSSPSRRSPMMICVFSFTLCLVSRFGNGENHFLVNYTLLSWLENGSWMSWVVMYFLLRLRWKPPGITPGLGMSFLRGPRAPFNFLHPSVPFGSLRPPRMR